MEVPTTTALSTQLASSFVSMTSREIARLTGKQHSHVMRDIRVLVERLSANPELDCHYETSTYLDEQGKPRDQYLLDRDTTLTLITGYDPVSRLRVVRRWQELETKPQLSPAELIIAQGKAMLALEQQQAAQAKQLAALEQRVARMDGDTGYKTVIAYSRVKGIDLPLSAANSMGRKASALAKKLGVQIGRVPDERFGFVNSYPTELLDEVFETQTTALQAA